ncbi:MAG: hypothetical protein R3C40_01745 [Parvularculaceae bacterium]
MEVAAAVETRRPIRETPAQRLLRETRAFFAALTRVILLSAILIPILLAAFLTVDLPIHSLDQFFSLPSVKPGNWLTMGLFIMSLAPLVAILIARRFGGDEASRVITASWGVAALLTFAEISYLSPLLEDGDMPSVTFVVAFVGGAMVGQYVAAAVYDVIRGAGQMVARSITCFPLRIRSAFDHLFFHRLLDRASALAQLDGRGFWS